MRYTRPLLNYMSPQWHHNIRRQLNTSGSGVRLSPRTSSIDTSSLSVLGAATKRFGQYRLVRPPSLRVGVAHFERRLVPASVTCRPPYADMKSNYAYEEEEKNDRSIELITTPDQVEGMRSAGRLAAQALQLAGQMIKVANNHHVVKKTNLLLYSSYYQPGITTNQLDETLHKFICEQGAYPSPLNYCGFPRSICTSVSNVIAHGIPDELGDYSSYIELDD
jgi:methionyl aminopeptidase